MYEDDTSVDFDSNEIKELLETLLEEAKQGIMCYYPNDEISSSCGINFVIDCVISAFIQATDKPKSIRRFDGVSEKDDAETDMVEYLNIPIENLDYSNYKYGVVNSEEFIITVEKINKDSHEKTND